MASVVAARDVITTCLEVQSSLLAVPRRERLLSLEASSALGHGRDCGGIVPLQSQVSSRRRRPPTAKGNGEGPEKGARSLGGCGWIVIAGSLSPVLSQLSCEQLLFSARIGRGSAFIHSV